MSIEKSLKRFRQKFNLTQAEVARKVGISRQVYSSYETGGAAGKIASPPIGVLIKISQAFNVSIDYLAGVSNNPNINCAPSCDGQELNSEGSNEFEQQMVQEITALKERMRKLESRFNF